MSGTAALMLQLYKIYLRMRSPKNGIPIKIRGPITRRVKAFKGLVRRFQLIAPGIEMIRWMKIALKISIEEALKLAQQMKDETYFHRIKDDHLPFAGDSTLYRFEVNTG